MTDVRRFGRTNAIIGLLLLLATVHCVRSIFQVNVSYIDLSKYSEGIERMPYQGRVVMMPVIRLAGHIRILERFAVYQDKILRNNPHFSHPPEDVTPEKLICIVVGLVAMLAVVGILMRLGWGSYGRMWWLPATMFLEMLYVSYAARYEAMFWYPYDLLHVAIFGLAALCILQGRYRVAILLFLVDLPVRETSLYLVPLLLAVGYARRQRWVAGWAVAMTAVWIVIRLTIRHFVVGHGSENYIHWKHIARSLFNPMHWAQVLSAFGFMLLPLCFGFRYLSRDQRFFVYGAVPGVIVTLVYGVWYESRIFDEWLIPMSVLLTVEFLAWRADSVDESTLLQAA